VVRGGWAQTAPKQHAPAKKKKKKNSQCKYVLYSALNWLRRACDVMIFCIAFLSSPYRETPKNAIKKIGKGGKFRRTTPQNIFYHVLSSPYREALNQRNKKVGKKRKKKSTRKKNPPPEKNSPGEIF
jgi:hypothetical protein